MKTCSSYWPAHNSSIARPHSLHPATSIAFFNLESRIYPEAVPTVACRNHGSPPHGDYITAADAGPGARRAHRSVQPCGVRPACHGSCHMSRQPGVPAHDLGLPLAGRLWVLPPPWQHGDVGNCLPVATSRSSRHPRECSKRIPHVHDDTTMAPVWERTHPVCPLQQTWACAPPCIGALLTTAIPGGKGCTCCDLFVWTQAHIYDFHIYAQLLCTVTCHPCTHTYRTPFTSPTTISA